MIPRGMTPAILAFGAATALLLASVSCTDVVGVGSIEMQVEMRFFDTTRDSGYVLLAATAAGGTFEPPGLSCTGFVPVSGQGSVRDSTFAEKGTEERVVSATCTATSLNNMSQGGASTVIPALR